MEYQEYINQMKEIYQCLYLFIKEENDEIDYVNYQHLISNIKKQNIQENKEELVIFLRLLLNIFNHHHRYQNFTKKMFQILDFLSEKIKQSFTEFEIFNLLMSNRMIILHLIENQIINIDKHLSNQIIQLSQGSQWSYKYFFYPDIKPFISEEEQLKIEKSIKGLDSSQFDENRRKGENDSMISSFIRNDSVSEFIIYLTKTNLPLSSHIHDSIFESNSILNEKVPTLIEYAMFYGSIQIVKYLSFNQVELNPSLWIYGIHSDNPEIIHFLEENNVEPPKGEYLECLLQSIECHHNEISEYINDQLLTSEKAVDSTIEEVISSFNFSEKPSEIDNQYIYKYSKLVDLYIKPKIDKTKEHII